VVVLTLLGAGWLTGDQARRVGRRLGLRGF
jgi:hypothetical protein